MEKVHQWLWSTFGGSAMVWDVALGIVLGVTLLVLLAGAMAVLVALAMSALKGISPVMTGSVTGPLIGIALILLIVAAGGSCHG